MRRALDRFLRLSRADRRLLPQAAALHAATVALLTTAPFRWTRWALWRWARPSTRRSRVDPDRIAWAVATAAASIGRGSCLSHALVAEALLRRYGLPARVRFGVSGATFHAWVESDGRVVVGGDMADCHQPLESCSAIANTTANSTALAGS